MVVYNYNMMRNQIFLFLYQQLELRMMMMMMLLFVTMHLVVGCVKLTLYAPLHTPEGGYAGYAQFGSPFCGSLKANFDRLSIWISYFD